MMTGLTRFSYTFFYFAFLAFFFFHFKKKTKRVKCVKPRSNAVCKIRTVEFECELTRNRS